MAAAYYTMRVRARIPGAAAKMPDGIKDALLIYNPASGRHRGRRFQEIERAARILTEAGITTEIASTAARATAHVVARQAVEQRRGLVIVCGGDGTINEVINGLAGSSVPMALLPAGTANILAKELGIPWDITRAARLIPAGIVRRIALGIAIPPAGGESAELPRDGRYFFSVAGAGPDGAIVNAVHPGLKRRTGEFAYWTAGFRQLFQYKFPEIRVHSNGRESRATIVVIGRTTHYGGPFKITTGASLFDDCFEILTHSTRSRAKYLASLPALCFGKLPAVKGIEVWKATEVICEPADSATIYAQADGEPIGALPIAFRVVPDAISIVTPAALQT